MRLCWALLLVCATLSVCLVKSSYVPTVTAPLAWSYTGSLGEASWWSTGFPNCDVTVQPNQSPIAIDTTGLVGPSISFALQLPAGQAPLRVARSVVGVTATNLLRADVWISSVVVNILVNGATASLSNRYLLHDIAVHMPSEHVIDGQRFDGEVTFVFFPWSNTSTRQSTYASGGFSLVMPFLSSNSLEKDRFEAMLTDISQSATLGAAQHIFSIPTFGAAATYTGSLTFPPCSGSMQTVVSLSPYALDAKVIAQLRAAGPAWMTNRSIQPLGTRTVRSATVTTTGVTFAHPSASQISSRAPSYIIMSPPLDAKPDAYGYGALLAGLISALLLACILVSFYERVTFVSPVRDVWTSPVLEQTVFGCVEESADDANDESKSGDDAQDEEDGYDEDEEGD